MQQRSRNALAPSGERPGRAGLRGLFVAGALVIGAALSVACAEPPAEVDVREIAPADLMARLESEDAPLVLDVRSSCEYAAGHVPGARNIPHDVLASRLGQIEDDRDRGIVVYCESGKRARLAEAVLREAGFPDVDHLSGDMAGWRASGLPVE